MHLVSPLTPRLTLCREIGLVIAPILNLFVLALMLRFQFRLKSFTWQGPKTAILMFLVFFQLLMIVNFALVEARAPFRVLLETIEEGTRGVILFLVAFYFLKKSSKILLNKQRWATITNIWLCIVLGIFVGVEVVCGFYVYLQDRTDYDACLYLSDLMLQFD